MAIDKLVAVVTILASIPTSVLSTDSTEDHQIQSIFPSDITECIDHLKSLLNDVQLEAHLRAVSCLKANELIYSQCLTSEIYPVIRSNSPIGLRQPILILLTSLGPYRLQQIPDADKEAYENLWRVKASYCGCEFEYVL
ncbi:MAG: hypothetical protein MHMPM18_001517 [Marteilia pararefringens]